MKSALIAIAVLVSGLFIFSNEASAGGYRCNNGYYGGGGRKVVYVNGGGGGYRCAPRAVVYARPRAYCAPRVAYYSRPVVYAPAPYVPYYGGYGYAPGLSFTFVNR